MTEHQKEAEAKPRSDRDGYIIPMSAMENNQISFDNWRLVHVFIERLYRSRNGRNMNSNRRAAYSGYRG